MRHLSGHENIAAPLCRFAVKLPAGAAAKSDALHGPIRVAGEPHRRMQRIIALLCKRRKRHRRRQRSHAPDSVPGKQLAAGHADRLGKRVVHAARAGVQVRMRGIQPDPMPDQKIRRRRFGIVRQNAFDAVKKQRMMHQHQVRVQRDRFLCDGNRAVQRDQNAADLAPGSDQKADVVVFKRKRGRRNRFEQRRKIR